MTKINIRNDRCYDIEVGIASNWYHDNRNGKTRTCIAKQQLLIDDFKDRIKTLTAPRVLCFSQSGAVSGRQTYIHGNFNE
jgi:hypothetical protein